MILRLLLAALFAMLATAAPAATAKADLACRVEPAAKARVASTLRSGEPLQLLTLQRDWALVRRQGAEPCWAAATGIAQGPSDVRSVTVYADVAGPSGRVALDAPAKASTASDCPCGTGRSCKGPSGNRFCISRGVLTTRAR